MYLFNITYIQNYIRFHPSKHSSVNLDEKVRLLAPTPIPSLLPMVTFQKVGWGGSSLDA